MSTLARIPSPTTAPSSGRLHSSQRIVLFDSVDRLDDVEDEKARVSFFCVCGPVGVEQAA